MYLEHLPCFELHSGDIRRLRNSQSRGRGKTSFNQGSFGYKKQKPIKLAQEMEGSHAMQAWYGVLWNPRQEAQQAAGACTLSGTTAILTSPKPLSPAPLLLSPCGPIPFFSLPRCFLGFACLVHGPAQLPPALTLYHDLTAPFPTN